MSVNVCAFVVPERAPLNGFTWHDEDAVMTRADLLDSENVIVFYYCVEGLGGIQVILWAHTLCHR